MSDTGNRKSDAVFDRGLKSEFVDSVKTQPFRIGDKIEVSFDDTNLIDVQSAFPCVPSEDLKNLFRIDDKIKVPFGDTSLVEAQIIRKKDDSLTLEIYNIIEKYEPHITDEKGGKFDNLVRDSVAFPRAPSDLKKLLERPLASLLELHGHKLDVRDITKLNVPDGTMRLDVHFRIDDTITVYCGDTRLLVVQRRDGSLALTVPKNNISEQYNEDLKGKKGRKIVKNKKGEPIYITWKTDESGFEDELDYYLGPEKNNENRNVQVRTGRWITGEALLHEKWAYVHEEWPEWPRVVDSWTPFDREATLKNGLRRKKRGRELDQLAVDRDGSLVLVEIKVAEKAKPSDIKQLSDYIEEWDWALRQSKVREDLQKDLQNLIDARKKLGLTPQDVPCPDLDRPIRAAICFGSEGLSKIKSDFYEKLDAVNARLPKGVNPIEIWKLDKEGPPCLLKHPSISDGDEKSAAEGPVAPEWNDPQLEVESDTQWRAEYRRLQSWYRETVLEVSPGADQRNVTRASMLREEDVERNPGLNFLDDDIAKYAVERAGQVKDEGGTIDRDRLMRNMLSSMPLCFNLFGYLRRHPGEAAQGLSAALGLDIDEILDVVVEWAPDPVAHLGDRTAFDAFVRYRTSDGRRAFLGVETKYTEPFSPKPYDSERYDDITKKSASGFKSGAEDHLRESKTNQLWRNALLVCSVRSNGVSGDSPDEFDDGHVVVLSCEGDRGAERAIEGLKEQLHEPSSLLRAATYEELMSKFADMANLRSWASEFRRRYLDLSPVLGDLEGADGIIIGSIEAASDVSETHGRAVRPGHRQSLRMLEDHQAHRSTIDAYAREMQGIPVYLRPTDDGLTVLSLDYTLCTSMIGVGTDGTKEHKLRGDLPPSQAEIRQAVAGYWDKANSLQRASAKEQFALTIVRQAYDRGLAMGTSGLYFVAHGWRLPSGVRLGILAVRPKQGRLVVVELKSDERAARESADEHGRGYAQEIYAYRQELYPFFQRLARAMAWVHGAGAGMDGVELDEGVEPEVVAAWPGKQEFESSASEDGTHPQPPSTGKKRARKDPDKRPSIPDGDEKPVATTRPAAVTEPPAAEGPVAPEYTFTERKRIRKDFGKRSSILDVPYLLAIQIDSYREFLQEGTVSDERTERGLHAAFKSVFPIESYSGDAALGYVSYRLEKPTFDVSECRLRGKTYAASLRVTLQLVLYEKETGGGRASKEAGRRVKDIKEQEVYMGEIPLMTDTGTFIINGTERVIVAQLHRSPGVFFEHDRGKTHSSGKLLFSARVIPYRGSWLDFEFDPKDLVYVRIDRRRKLQATVLLRALGYSAEEILALFFDLNSFELTPEGLRFKLVPERLRGDVAAFDIKDKEGSVLVEAGRRITARHINRMTKAGLDTLEVVDDYAFGKNLGRDVVDTETGEIIANANDGVTGELLGTLRKHGVETFETLYTNDVDRGPYMSRTLTADSTQSQLDAQVEIYRMMRPGEPPTKEAAQSLFHNLFFSAERYDISPVGRMKFNRRVGRSREEGPGIIYDGKYIKSYLGYEEKTVEKVKGKLRVDSKGKWRFKHDVRNGKNGKLIAKRSDPVTEELLHRAFDAGQESVDVFQTRRDDGKMAALVLEHDNESDIIRALKTLVDIKNGIGMVDDIDHLGNRRIRSVGEMAENQFRIGLVRVERAVKERLSLAETEELMPQGLINAKPVSAVVKEFFGSSQLSQFMDQNNPLSEVTHKRRVSALGPGGLTRERAGFEVRDVHPTHYGRVCTIETPEGPNIGLINSLAVYARTNRYGFLETPYRKVESGRVTDAIHYLSAIEEGQYVIAQANATLDDEGRLVDSLVTCRHRNEATLSSPDRVQYMDVSPKQIVSVAASLIPFLEHDDANRALMGSNMQRQAVPTLKTEKPLVGTGMERKVAIDSGVTVVARRGGMVDSVDAARIVVRVDDEETVAGEPGVDIYSLIKYTRSNQNTCINQRPLVKPGDEIARGDVLADGPSTDMGELALGQNMLVAFMPWNGYNFEDSILISERVVEEDRYTTIHIEELVCFARDTKLGPEDITSDIPNVSESALSKLDESGIVYVGAEVKTGDILVGKVTPKGETQLTPEEKLLRAIFGEKASDVKDTSLRVPAGMNGTIINVQVFTRDGVEKDARAKQIEESELEKVRKDLDDQYRILADDIFLRLERLLVDQLADGGPGGLGVDERSNDGMRGIGPPSGGSRFLQRMQRHQSWYRDQVLDVSYGESGRKDTRHTHYGHMLTKESADAGLNFLTPDLFEKVKERFPKESTRLWRNMLSSQPMCFNLFGQLKCDYKLATDLANALWGEQEHIAEVTNVCFEWKPEPAEKYLADGTAFDVFIEYRTVDGQNGFVGIETKLTEPFTKEPYDNPKYQEWKEKENPWKAEAAYDEIFRPERNQLARDHLLAWALLHQPDPEYTEGRLVVIYHPQDDHCGSTIERYRALLRDEAMSSFSSVDLREIVSKWKPRAGEASWLSKFEERYLALEKSEGAEFEPEVALRAPKGEEANNQDIGTRITEDYLRSIDRQQWFEIRLLNDEASAQLEKAREQLEAQKALLEEYFEEKRGKLTSGDDLAPGVLKMVKVYLAVKRRVQPGDKVAGRHGNKGVISMIVPVEDMPYMNDGTPVDIVLNPLGVPSRMNVGQVLEAHLGWAAKELGHSVARMLESFERTSKVRRFLRKVYAIKGKEDPVGGLNDSELLELADNLRGGVPMATPVFDGASESEIKDLLALAGLPRDGQTRLFDGRTGEPFDRPVTVGYMYMMKLNHLVDDKMHARSTGPYSLVTQQPLGGKAQFGGQRFGEMEVWALEAYGAAYTLQEMLTVKSDDVNGRTKMYKNIVDDEHRMEAGMPESFNVLMKEIRSLGIDIELEHD